MAVPPIAAYSPQWDYATNPVASLNRDMQNAFAGMERKPRRLTARERLEQRRARAREIRKAELRRLAYHAPRHRIWRHWITVGTLGGIVLFALLVAVFP